MKNRVKGEVSFLLNREANIADEIVAVQMCRHQSPSSVPKSVSILARGGFASIYTRLRPIWLPHECWAMDRAESREEKKDISFSEGEVRCSKVLAIHVDLDQGCNMPLAFQCRLLVDHERKENVAVR